MSCSGGATSASPPTGPAPPAKPSARISAAARSPLNPPNIFSGVTQMAIKRLGDPSEISDAVIVGNMVYLAGVVPEDPVPPSLYEQTKNVLKQIDEVLAQAGTDKTRL